MSSRRGKGAARPRGLYPEEFLALLERTFQVVQLFGQTSLTLTVAEQLRAQEGDRGRDPSSWVRSFVRWSGKATPGERRNASARADIRGRWREFVIREVSDVSEFATDYPSLLALATRPEPALSRPG
jgi:hypothetical protein